MTNKTLSLKERLLKELQNKDPEATISKEFEKELEEYFNRAIIEYNSPKSMSVSVNGKLTAILIEEEEEINAKR